MKSHTRRRTVFAVGLAASLCLSIWPSAAAQTGQKQSAPVAEKVGSAAPATAFEERVKEYVKLREGLEEKLPKLSKESTPEQIEAHKASFMKMVQAARAGAKPGMLFTPDVAAHIRSTIKDTFKGQERVELRKSVLEAETQGVPIRVNYPYPESKEQVEMPPTLLLKLPTLPKQVKYRFVGRQLLLVDRENTLILDYMTGALP